MEIRGSNPLGGATAVEPTVNLLPGAYNLRVFLTFELDGATYS